MECRGAVLKLKKSLKKRFEEDQKLLGEKQIEEWEKACCKNSRWLKGVVFEKGWPAEEKVGPAAELHAWLIVQHSPDLSFQKEILETLKHLPKTIERKKHIKFLTDRTLVKEGKPQIYNTQFSNGSLI